VVFGFGRWGQAAETVFTDTVRIQTNGTSDLIFETVPGGGYSEQVWHLGGSSNLFNLYDQTHSTNPFTIQPGANNNDSLFIGSNGFLGFGTTSPQRKLHLFDQNSIPTVRFDDSSGTNNTWDIEGGGFGFNVIDVTNGSAIPFSVLPGAPTDSLFIAANGSVGMGTAMPNLIGATPTTGRFINVTADTGFARFVLQGASGGELNVVHNAAGTNQKILRIRSASGTASFNIVKDDLSNNAIANAIAIRMSDGNIGLKVANPTNPLQLASGAFCSSGGVWTNASSRELKQDIVPLTSEEARETVQKLQPVGYRYKNELDEQYVGFIAEDVPDLVARKDRKSLASMDITAVLTKVVQDQDRLIGRQERELSEERQRIDQQQKLLTQLNETVTAQQAALAALTRRLTELERTSAN
jgi:endosialidase-like protein